MTDVPYHGSHFARIRVMAAGAGLMLALAACGGPSAAGAAPSTAPNPSATSPSPPSSAPSAGMSMAAKGEGPRSGSAGGGARPATANVVAIRNFAFEPATLTVPAGTTVTWTNDDQDPHTVTARDKTFASPTLATGKTFHFTFTKPGRYAYLCTIHPFMTATVVVTP